MTDEELDAVREFTGDLLIRAFRGEVDLASALAEVRDLAPADLAEEADLPDDDDDDAEKPEGEPEPEGEPAPTAEELDASDADAAEALAALGL